MKEQNEVIEKLNEEVINEVGQELTTSGSNVFAKVAVAVLVAAAGVGAFIFYKKKKNSKKYVITESNLIDEDVEVNEVEE